MKRRVETADERSKLHLSLAASFIYCRLSALCRSSAHLSHVKSKHASSGYHFTHRLISSKEM